MPTPATSEETHAQETGPGQPNAPLHEPQSTPADAVGALRKVMAACQTSAQGMENASEHIQARGLKLLFKAAAQQRLQYIQELQPFLEQLAVDTDINHAALPDLAQGFTDLQAALTLPREGRQEIVVAHQISLEDQLLDAYREALAAELPSHVLTRLGAQRSRMETSRNSLEQIAADKLQLVARLFDATADGQAAVERLRDAGIAEQMMDVFELEDLPVQAVATIPPHADTGSTVAAGALSGGLIGAVIGGFTGLFVWIVPGAIGMLSVSPALLLVSAAIFGALFGAIFGLLIGRSKAEDDRYVTIEGLLHGSMLVAVYAQPEQIDFVEEVLHIHHGRELPSDSPAGSKV